MAESQDWEKDPKRLLDDVDAFVRKVLDKESRGVAEPTATESRPIGARASGAPPQPAIPLLDRLKQMAEAKQREEEAISTRLIESAMGLSGAIERVFVFLRDLTQQLNILQPVHMRPFAFHGSISFENLAWRDGQADYYLRATNNERRIFEKVTLRCYISASEPMRIEREQPAMDRLRDALAHWHIPYTLNEIRNDRGNVVRGLFVFTPALRGFLSLVADDAAGLLRLKMNNIEHFGASEFELAPDALDLATLDELGKLLLGETSTFVHKFKRLA
jgi:hypothetical protein